MASIKRKEKKNGGVVYRIQISLGCDPRTGKRVPKVITFSPNQNATPKQQEKEALKHAMEWEDKLKNGESYEGQEVSFAEYADRWLTNIKQEVAYSTYQSYERIVNKKILPFFAVYKVAKIKTPLVEEFYKTLRGNANGTIQKIANVLSGMFRTAVRWQMIQVNPCRDAKVPKNKEEESALKYFTPEQSLMFLKSLDMTFETVVKGHQRTDDTGKHYVVEDYTEQRKLPLQLKVFYTLSLYCGFRKGETLALQWSDIDFEKKEISITKSVGKTEKGVALKKPKTATSVRTVSLPEKILPLLKQYKREYALYRLQLGTEWKGAENLFIQNDGTLMGYSTSYQAFRRHLERYNNWVQNNREDAKKQGLEPLPNITLHGLRHSCATLLNYLDVNIIDISKVLGHAKASTTMDIYAHSFQEQNRVAANKLNAFLEERQQMQA